MDWEMERRVREALGTLGTGIKDNSPKIEELSYGDLKRITKRLRKV